MIISFLLSILSTVFFLVLIFFLVALWVGFGFIRQLRNGMKGGNQQQHRQQRQQQRPQPQQQAEEATPDPTTYEQPLFDDENAEYVEYEEMK